MRRQQFNQVGVVGEDIHWPSLDRGKNFGMEVLDLVRHPAMLAETLTSCKGVRVKPNVRAKRATTAGRQARAGENVPRTARPGLVACRWRSA